MYGLGFPLINSKVFCELLLLIFYCLPDKTLSCNLLLCLALMTFLGSRTGALSCELSFIEPPGKLPGMGPLLGRDFYSICCCFRYWPYSSNCCFFSYCLIFQGFSVDPEVSNSFVFEVFLCWLCDPWVCEAVLNEAVGPIEGKS